MDIMSKTSAKRTSTTNKSAKKTSSGSKKGRKWNGNWNEIPSSRQLLALAIMSIETGKPIVIPTTREGAKEALGYS